MGAGDWTTWTGVNLIQYSRRVNSSPPITVRGADTAELEEEQRQAEARLAEYGTNWPELQAELQPAS